MKGRAALMIVLVASTVGALWLSTRAQVPKDKPKAVLYHPTRVGAKWVYKSNDLERVEVVTAVKEKGGEWLVTVGREREERGVQNIHVMAVSEKGLAFVSVIGGEMSEPFWLLKFPHSDGNKWEAVLAAKPGGRAIGSAEAHGPEQVEVPAGKYQAIRVELEIPFIDGRGGKGTKDDVVLRPRSAMVKEIYGEHVRLLKSFDPGKE